jgi:hypothetical protein
MAMKKMPFHRHGTHCSTAIGFSDDLHLRLAGFEGGDVPVVDCAYGHKEESEKETQSAAKNFRQERETGQAG